MSINSLLSSLQSFGGTQRAGLLSSDRTQSYSANGSLAALIAKRSKYRKKTGLTDAGVTDSADSVDASSLADATAAPAADAGQAAQQDPKAQAAEKLAQNKRLEGSLSEVLNYVTDTYGTSAAQAMRGVILNKLGDQDVTEDSLGKAMLSGISFIDHQFGIAQGDKFMAKINDSLNGAMNSFFDNGSSEVFFDAAKTDTAFLVDRVAIAADKVSKDIADAVTDMMDDGADAQAARRRKKLARRGYGPQAYDQQGQAVNSQTYASGQAVDVAA